MIDQSKDSNKPKGPLFGISSVILGLYVSGLLIYCLIISDENCLRYIGRRGIGEDCSQDKKIGLFRLGFLAAFALLFLVLGILDILEKKQKSGSAE